MKPKVTGAILGFSAGMVFGSWFLSHYEPGDLPMVSRITILILIAGSVTVLGAIMAYALQRLFHPTEGKAVRRGTLIVFTAFLVFGALLFGLAYWSYWENTPEQQQKQLAQLRADNIAARQDIVALRLYGKYFDSLAPSERERVQIQAAAEDLADRVNDLE